MLPALLCGAAVAGRAADDTEFAAYLLAFNKSYSAAERPARAARYAEAKLRWREHATAHPDARFGATRFADWSDAELRAARGAARAAYYGTAPRASLTAADAAAAPTSFDWRDSGAVTGIKDQGQCGGCWAFSTVANIEGVAVVQGKQSLTSLSEQELLDCSSYCGSEGGYLACNQGCGGGLQPLAFDDMTKSSGTMNGKGLETEAAYPFTGKNGKKCNYKSPAPAKISSWQWVSQNAGQEAGMAAALVKYGPLAVSVNDGGTGGPWMSYTGGVLSGAGCSGDLNHGVTLVGYGTDSGKDYWLVKNSWGTKWGLQGYIKLARGSCQCGICKYASTAIW